MITNARFRGPNRAQYVGKWACVGRVAVQHGNNDVLCSKVFAMDKSVQEDSPTSSGHCIKENYKLGDPPRKSDSWYGALWMFAELILSTSLFSQTASHLCWKMMNPHNGPFAVNIGGLLVFLLLDFNSKLTCRNGYFERNKMRGKQMITLVL